MAVRRTKENKELFLEVFKKTAGNVSQACKAIKINRKTFYDWCKKDKKFKDKIDEINESLIDNVETLAYKKIKEGDTTMLIFFLKTKAKHRGWTEKMEIAHTNANIEINIE